MLSKRNKADRGIMVERIVELAATLQAECAVETVGAQVIVRLAKADLTLNVTIDGESSQPTVFVETWNTKGGRRLSQKHFPERNPCHGRKCNFVAHGFEALIAEVDRGLSLGEAAFETGRETGQGVAELAL